MVISKIARLIKEPKKVLPSLLSRTVLLWVPDKVYVSIMFRMKMGRKLDLKNPKSFNEKLQWIKLYDRNPLYTRMVDKYEAKGWIAEMVGEEYVIPTIGIWDNFDEIDFDKLPDEFIMKTTHDSGTFVICHDKNKLNMADVRERMERSLRKNYYKHGREWPYKNVKPRIIVEQLLKNPNGAPLSDYKFYCFDGVVRMSHITFGRGSAEGLSMNYYDRDLNLLPVQHYKYPNFKGKFVPPTNYEKMVELASILSKGIPHVRVDFYEADNRVYLGELTFFTDGGFGYYRPQDFDYTVGSWMTLKDVKKN